jgi:flavodoxin
MSVMKKLVVYYSLDGNTSFISKVIAEAIGADVLELKPMGAAVPRGFMKFFWGGKQVFSKVKPELLPFDVNPQDYDLIFIGTPVWAWRHTPAVESFFSRVSLTNKKVAVFCCHAGGKGKTLEGMKDRLKGNTIIGQMDFRDPLRHNKEANAARAGTWAEQLAGV